MNFSPSIKFDPCNSNDYFFQTIKLCYQISNFANMKMKFNETDCLVKNSAV